MSMLRQVALLPLVFVLSACLCVPPRGAGIGDSGTDITIRNAASERITLTEVAQGPQGTDLVTHLAPGEERRSLWHFTTGSRVTIRASSDSGLVNYCHRFVYEEVRSADSVVVIQAGRLDCQ